jgi:hypothetical protein
VNIKLIIANFLFCLGFVFLVWAAPRGEFVLVVTSPFETNASRIDKIAKADGSIVASGRFDWIVVAHSIQPGFASRLLKAGALMVLNENLALGCARGQNGIFGKTS